MRLTVARPGEPGGETWGDLPLQFRAGGAAWVAGSYDPESFSLLGHGTSETRARVARGTDGDALYKFNLALDPDREMQWYYQHLPGETHDMDEVFENLLIDIEGRKSLFKIGKLGILWQLDRINGEYINATDLGYQNIVSLNQDTGEVRYRDGMIPRIGEQLDMCPSTSGFNSWRAMSYDPTLSMLFIPITLNCELATFGPVEQCWWWRHWTRATNQYAPPRCWRCSRRNFSSINSRWNNLRYRSRPITPQLSPQQDWYFW